MTASDAGQYTATVSNTAGTTFMTARQVLVNVPPSVPPLQVLRHAVYEGDVALLQAAATGDPVPGLQWLVDGQPVASGTSAVLQLATSASGTHTVEVVATNAAGNASASVTFAISPLPGNALGFDLPLANVTAACQASTGNCQACLNSSATALQDCAYCAGGSTPGCMAGIRHSVQSQQSCEAAGGLWIVPGQHTATCAAIQPTTTPDPSTGDGTAAQVAPSGGLDMNLVIYAAGGGVILLLVVLLAVIVVRYRRHQRAAKDLQRRQLQHDLNQASIAASNLQFQRMEPELRAQLQHYFYIDQTDRTRAQADAEPLLPVEPRMIAPRSIHVIEHIGSGHFGDVYSGELLQANTDDSFEILQAQKVALKILAKANPSVQETQEFLREAALMAQFQHASQ